AAAHVLVRGARLPGGVAAERRHVRGRGRRPLPAGRPAPLGRLRRAHVAAGTPRPLGAARHRGDSAPAGRRAVLPPRHVLLPAARWPRRLLSGRLRTPPARPHPHPTPRTPPPRAPSHAPPPPPPP